MSKTSKRRQFSPQQKASILREHLVDKALVSELCERHDLQPSVFYQWRAQLLDGAEGVLETRRGRHPRTPVERELEEARLKVAALEARLARKDEVIAQLAEENVGLKKADGGA